MLPTSSTLSGRNKPAKQPELGLQCNAPEKKMSVNWKSQAPLPKYKPLNHLGNWKIIIVLQLEPFSRFALHPETRMHNNQTTGLDTTAVIMVIQQYQSSIVCQIFATNS